MEFNEKNVLKKIAEVSKINVPKVFIRCGNCNFDWLEDLEEIKGRKPPYVVCRNCGKKISIAEIFQNIKERKYGKL